VEEVSEARTYYVYALKDPRTTPAKPFYIGKGTGIRSNEHELDVDDSAKGTRIKDIQSKGLQVLVSRLVDEVTELEALKIEAKLIAAFGTESTGGLLTNAVTPSLNVKGRRVRALKVPTEVQERAQLGLGFLKQSVLELSIANEDGVTNSDVAHTLGLQSDYLGGSKDYLSWSILGLLMREGKLRRVDKKRHKAQVR
jgi:hypothetical protein